MGRIFETRKHVMFARYARMSKAFNRIRKEIEIAVTMPQEVADELRKEALKFSLAAHQQ